VHHHHHRTTTTTTTTTTATTTTSTSTTTATLAAMAASTSASVAAMAASTSAALRGSDTTAQAMAARDHEAVASRATPKCPFDVAASSTKKKHFAGAANSCLLGSRWIATSLGALACSTGL